MKLLHTLAVLRMWNLTFHTYIVRRYNNGLSTVYTIVVVAEVKRGLTIELDIAASTGDLHLSGRAKRGGKRYCHRRCN